MGRFSLGLAATYDSTGRYGAQTPFSDNLGAYWAGGQWQVDTTHNAIVAVTNGGTRPTEALLTLYFDDGKKNYEIQQTIQPGDQMWLNLADLIHHSVPDRKGNVLPAEITSGTYDLEDLNPGLGGNLIEGKVALDKTFGHLTYGCLECCGYTPFLDPNPVNVVVGGAQDISTLGDNNCNGAQFDLTSYFNATGKWWSLNAGIASVTAFQAQGVAPGTTYGWASAYIPNGDGFGVRHGSSCPKATQAADAPVPVGPYQVEPIFTASQGAAACPAGQAGWARNVTNQLQYQDGSPYAVSGITVADTISIGGTNQLGLHNPKTGQTTTTGDGSFPDNYSVCSTFCPASSGYSNALQQWTAYGVPLPHVNGVVYKCQSITVDGN